ncbi:MAG: beta-lactamase family protein [Acidobacteria bacterium]|nr:beta-lactamase family protein [Acidobacteriota bacterium]
MKWHTVSEGKIMTTKLTRRELLSLGVQATIIAGAGSFFVTDSDGMAQSTKEDARYKDVFRAVDRFVAQYMLVMNSPGMILALASREGVLRASTYGFSDLELKLSVKQEQLFHVASISKSFAAIALLQLYEENKLDLHKPVVEYLPWLKIESPYAPITTHHLLTHSAGLPRGAPLFLSDPAAKHRVAYAPGEHYQYSNLGYVILGQLLGFLDQRHYGESIRRRILEPLGMNDTAPIINSDILDRTVRSYVPYHSERPYPRNGKLTQATELIFDMASGSVASTAHDMGLYVSMLANRGKGAKARVLSEESFNLLVKPQIKADEQGPTASYGYGLVIDRMDGHSIARHTGGAVSFMSAMQIDLDEGLGVFASINAQQGYRPNPVAIYVLKTLRAANAGQPLPLLPPPNAPSKIQNANEYAGVFSSPDGRKIEFKAEGDSLYLLHKNQHLQMETAANPGFLVQHPDFDRFLFRFAREQGDKGLVTEISHGADWYVNEKYSGPHTFSTPKEWDAFVGHYRITAQSGSVRIVRRKGMLWLNGTVPLDQIDANTFKLADKQSNCDWIRFLDVVNGEAMLLKRRVS